QAMYAATTATATASDRQPNASSARIRVAIWCRKMSPALNTTTAYRTAPASVSATNLRQLIPTAAANGAATRETPGRTRPTASAERPRAPSPEALLGPRDARVGDDREPAQEAEHPVAVAPARGEPDRVPDHRPDGDRADEQHEVGGVVDDVRPQNQRGRQDRH